MPPISSTTKQFVFPDLDTLEASIQALNKEEKPLEWARLMNMKGVILTSLAKYTQAGPVFNEAIPLADGPLKCKIFINYAKTNFFADKKDVALQLISRVFETAKGQKSRGINLLLGFAHMLRGQIFYQSKNEKTALTEFKKAEFFFDGEANLIGVGLACMEIARVHVNNKNLTTAWNYLKKSENCLRVFGAEENLGVSVCKAVALFYSGKEEEAQQLLKQAYKACNEFGLAKYMLSEMLDAYLEIRSKSLHFQKNLV
jgi:tetratricopeptide (TPR) repeat protein